jgi:Uma2 family endonuclease
MHESHEPPSEQMYIPSTLSRHRLSIADYHKMADAGILTEDDRVELIEGEIIDMPPISSDQAGTVKLLARMLMAAVGDRAIVAIQDPIVFPDFSEPQPDLAILHLRDDYYRKSHPHPGDVQLLIEVAVTTGDYDRKTKVPLYASHRIPEVWLFDLSTSCLEVYYAPEKEGYQHLDFHRQGSVSARTVPAVTVDVAEIFNF